MIALDLAPPWLVLDLGADHRVLSWSLNCPGFAEARRIVWREVRNADLPRDLDAGAWLRAELARAGHADAVALLTSRDLRRVMRARTVREGVAVDVVATVGLSNAEAVGARLGRPSTVGTINVAAVVSAGLTDGALAEAVSIVAQARTAAVLGCGLRLPTGRATGTGTDCIAVAAPPGGCAHAGLHTPLGEALGRAVLDAVGRGAADWMTDRGADHAGR